MRQTSSIKGIGSKIAQARSQRNLTQAELAATIGVKTGTISNLEANGNRIPKMNTLQGIADALNLDIDYFLSESLKIYKDTAREEISELEKEILLNFYSLSPLKKEAMLEFLEKLAVLEHKSKYDKHVLSENRLPEATTGCAREIMDIVSQLNEENQFFVLDFVQRFTTLKSKPPNSNSD